MGAQQYCWQKLQLQEVKLWTWTQMKQEMFVSADFSSWMDVLCD